MKRHRLDLALALLIFALALGLRAFAARHLFMGDLSFDMGDDDDYYSIAISLVQGHGFAINGVPTAYRMPFFPLFVAFWHLILGPQPYAPLPIFLIMSALIPVGVYALGLSIADWPIAGLAAMIIAADVDLIRFSYHYMTETLFCFLVLSGMLAAWRLRVVGSWRWAIGTGLLLGGATLTRANFGPFVLLLGLWLLWHGRARPWRAARNAALVVGLVGALWVPWAVRNALLFGHFIPFTTQSGSAYFGIYNDVVTGGDPTRPFGYWLWLEPQLPAAPGKLWDEAAYDQYQRELAREWIVANPTKAIAVAFMQPVHLWSPQEVALVSWTLTVPVGLSALFIFGLRRRGPELSLWLGLALMMSALTLISAGVGRYHLPLRPILAVTTAMFFAGLAAELRTLWRRSIHLLRGEEKALG